MAIGNPGRRYSNNAISGPLPGRQSLPAKDKRKRPRRARMEYLISQTVTSPAGRRRGHFHGSKQLSHRTKYRNIQRNAYRVCQEGVSGSWKRPKLARLKPGAPAVLRNSIYFSPVYDPGGRLYAVAQEMSAEVKKIFLNVTQGHISRDWWCEKFVYIKSNEGIYMA